MYNGGETSGILRHAESFSQETAGQNAPSPKPSNSARYQRSQVCNNISDRFWKKFNNLRLAPLSVIRNKIRQKDFSFGSNSRAGYTNGNRLL
jgi:hypothetical protein